MLQIGRLDGQLQPADGGGGDEPAGGGGGDDGLAGWRYMHDPEDEVRPSSLHVPQLPALSHEPSLTYRQAESLSHAAIASTAVL